MAPRLKSLPSRVSAAPSRLGAPPTQTGPSPKRQRFNAPWRGWYSTKRWKDLRLKVLVRDNYTCQRSGALCAGTYPAPDSPTVNHKVPHRGDPALFWDEANLETITKEVHDTIVQKEEQASLHHRGHWDI
jgi:5-methylcytosine-specific restriction protein A